MRALSARRLGLSIVDATPRELCFISLRDLFVWHSASNVFSKVELSCMSLQVDNQLSNPVHPVCRPCSLLV